MEEKGVCNGRAMNVLDKDQQILVECFHQLLVNGIIVADGATHKTHDIPSVNPANLSLANIFGAASTVP